MSAFLSLEARRELDTVEWQAVQARNLAAGDSAMREAVRRGIVKPYVPGEALRDWARVYLRVNDPLEQRQALDAKRAVLTGLCADPEATLSAALASVTGCKARPS